jgi:hypothetical protein
LATEPNTLINKRVRGRNAVKAVSIVSEDRDGGRKDKCGKITVAGEHCVCQRYEETTKN